MKTWITHSLFAMAGLCTAFAANAGESWPSKPLRIVVPFQAGSFTDLAARKLAVELSSQLGQTVIVENRAGAGGTIGADSVAKSAPDGHTLLLTENSFTVSPALYPKLPYRAKEDFIPLTTIAEAPTIMWGRPNLPVKSVKELVELARSKPGLLTFGSGGQGTSSHLAGELFFEKVQISVVHVPYKGVAGSIGEAAAGRVDFGTSSIASPMGQIKAGRLLPIAVTGKERNPLLPDVPTFAESGFAEYDAPIWFGLLLPAGTPAQIVSRLHDEVSKAVAKPQVSEVFVKQGARTLVVSPQEFSNRIAAEIQQWQGLIKRVGIKIE